jgi:hypothetical protein
VRSYNPEGLVMFGKHEMKSNFRQLKMVKGKTLWIKNTSCLENKYD